MVNQVRCALAFYGMHEKRECAFRVDTISKENNEEEDEEDEDEERSLTMPMD